jgi:hypothetical protein
MPSISRQRSLILFNSNEEENISALSADQFGLGGMIDASLGIVGAKSGTICGLVQTSDKLIAQ